MAENDKADGGLAEARSGHLADMFEVQTRESAIERGGLSLSEMDREYEAVGRAERQDQRDLAQEGQLVDLQGRTGQREVTHDGDRTNDAAVKPEPETAREKVADVAQKVAAKIRPQTEFEAKLAAVEERMRNQEQGRGR